MPRDPFNRKDKVYKPSPFGEKGRVEGAGKYPGQEGVEILFRKAIPYILVRTDPRVSCVCADISGKTGDAGCLRCLGTGKVVRSLDRFRGYITSRKPLSPGEPSEMGWQTAETRYVYSGRWVYPSVGDLVLEVGWDVPNSQALDSGEPLSIEEVHLVKRVIVPGFEQLTYTCMSVVSANIRKPFIEPALLFGDFNSLPPYRSITPESEV